MKVIILKGLPGSGKSTYAKNLIDKNPGKYKRINKDSLREMLDNGKWSKANEKFVESVRDLLIIQALEAGYHVIVDDTNFAPQHEERIRQLAKGKAEVSVQFFDTPVEECIKRDLDRSVSVGEKVIRRMYYQFICPKPNKPKWVDGKPRAIIVDLDGTLALIGDRNPYDGSLSELDDLNTAVYEIVSRYQHEIVLMSGRHEKYRTQTENWLHENAISYAALFMRATGDGRKDSIVKRELFDNNVYGNWNIDYVIDDRDQVVRMWRHELGLTVFQCAEGDF